MHHHILEYDHSGLKYTFEDQDVTLIVPEGAVARGQTVHIEFDVTCIWCFHFPRELSSYLTYCMAVPTRERC